MALDVRDFNGTDEWLLTDFYGTQILSQLFMLDASDSTKTLIPMSYWQLTTAKNQESLDGSAEVRVDDY